RFEMQRPKCGRGGVGWGIMARGAANQGTSLENATAQFGCGVSGTYPPKGSESLRWPQRKVVVPMVLPSVVIAYPTVTANPLRSLWQVIFTVSGVTISTASMVCAGPLALTSKPRPLAHGVPAAWGGGRA